MKEYKGFPAMIGNRLVYREVPQMADEIVQKLFVVDGKPHEELVTSVLQTLTEYLEPAQILSLATTALEAF